MRLAELPPLSLAAVPGVRNKISLHIKILQFFVKERSRAALKSGKSKRIRKKAMITAYIYYNATESNMFQMH